MKKLFVVTLVIMTYSCGDVEVERNYLYRTSELSLQWQYITAFKNQETYPAYGLDFVITDSPQTITADMNYVSSKISESAYRFIRDNDFSSLASMQTSGLFGKLMNCARSAVVCLQENDSLSCNCDSIKFPY